MGTKRLGWGFWLAVVWLAVVIAVAYLAPFLPVKDSGENFVGGDAAGPRSSPSFEHWFGTDDDARDVFARTVDGARVSLTVGIVSIALSMVVGGALGLVSGYLGGWTDRVVGFVFLALLSFPALVLAILITSFIGRTLTTIALTLGIVSIAPVGRLARAATVQFAEREFVVAAEALGATKRRIMVRELLPNVAVPMAALSLLGMAIAVVAEGALAFLGLSVEDTITWGTLIRNGAAPTTLERAPWVAFTPIGVLFATVLALNFAGDRLRDYFDARELAL